VIVRAFAHGLRDFPQTSSDSAITLAEVRGKAAARWLRPFYSRQRTVAGIDLRGLDRKVTEPLAVASGLKHQLFKTLSGNDFID